MRQAYFLSLLIFAACAGCPPRPDPYPIPDAEVTTTEAGLWDVVVQDAGIADVAEEETFVPDATSGSDAALTPCVQACENLQRIQCSQATNCDAVCQHVVDTHLTDLHLSDCIKAPDKNHLGKCSIHCGL